MERWILTTLAAFLALCLYHTHGQVLNPPYFNLAEGKKVTASSTCGVGVSDREWYCRLTGANYISYASGAPVDYNNVNTRRPGQIIQGQLCGYCDPRDPQHNHPSDNAADGTEKWWQSPPLSRGMKFNAVNLTVDLGQVRCTTTLCLI